jgi:heptaprenyl diphosphate synthase
MNTIKTPFHIVPAAIRAEIDATLRHTPDVLSDMLTSLTLSQGKNIRGTLTVLSAADEAQQVDGTAIKIAAAIEILHLASLVHDDIIDDADTRRGKPSLHSQFGKKNAVMAGDYLFCLCFSLISEAYSLRDSSDYIEKISDFSKAMSVLCLGEIRQNKHNFDFDLTFKDYLKIIGGKTASLFALSMYAGARAGGLSHLEAKTYGRIGGYFGVIFQLIDDCLDYDSQAHTAQKPVGKDLREGIITLPLIYALKKDPQIRELFKAGIPEDFILDQTILKIKALGGVDYTREMAYRYYLKAMKFINTLQDEFKKQELIKMLDRIYDRQM